MSDILPTLKMFDPETDYETVAGWWEGHGWPALHKAFLPKLGVMALFNEKPVASGWVYLDNSCGVSILEWMVADPEAAPKKVYKGIKCVASFLRDRAKDMGYTIMLTTCKQDSLAKVYEKSGFKRTDENMIHLVQFLK